MYFSESFPKLNYDIKGDGQTILIEDLLHRVTVRKGVSNTHTLFVKYNIADWESPESVAYRLYGNTKYHWIIMMTNTMFDRFYDWPLSERTLIRYAEDKYDDSNAIHHYEISQSSGDSTKKIQVESDVPFAETVTNLEYEQKLNDTKKSIKILKPEYITMFAKEYKVLQHSF